MRNSDHAWCVEPEQSPGCLPLPGPLDMRPTRIFSRLCSCSCGCRAECHGPGPEEGHPEIHAAQAGAGGRHSAHQLVRGAAVPSLCRPWDCVGHSKEAVSAPLCIPPGFPYQGAMPQQSRVRRAFRLGSSVPEGPVQLSFLDIPFHRPYSTHTAEYLHWEHLTP